MTMQMRSTGTGLGVDLAEAMVLDSDCKEVLNIPRELVHLSTLELHS